ncbi:hypothetical protein GALL_532980 [mine drainage metagenome]|uniref:Uncharacterized protein n=1 Tax=mine drainage metagenome TaxID=410659 RepID=A0A1J5P0S7_9ZZZZ
MVVDRPAGQIKNLLGRALGHGVAVGIGQADDRIVIGHIEAGPDQGHAEGTLQVLCEDRAQIGHAVAIGVAQQDDLVGALFQGAGRLLHPLGDPVFQARGLGGLGGGFRGEDVAVGQDIEPAGMVQARGEGRDREAGGRLGLGPSRPGDGLGDIHRRQQTLVGRGQVRLWPEARERRGRPLAAGGKGKCGQADRRDVLAPHGASLDVVSPLITRNVARRRVRIRRPLARLRDGSSDPDAGAVR